MTTTHNGIEYKKPTVVLLNESGIGAAEVAARTCYDSFEGSDNPVVKDFPIAVESYELDPQEYNWNDYKNSLNKTEDSELLDRLAWAYHHHSILEHSTLSFYISGTSRGVLQEHSRHRIQAISVRSTRYTMSEVLYSFIANYYYGKKAWFIKRICDLDMFVTTGDYNQLEASAIYDKLQFHIKAIGKDEFLRLCLTKDNIEKVHEIHDSVKLFEALVAGKKKRNAGDSFKHIVTDNWKVDLVVSFNIRSLKNYFDLRDSGAAWFQIQWLAEAMKAVTPLKYLKLIDKNYKDK